MPRHWEFFAAVAAVPVLVFAAGTFVGCNTKPAAAPAASTKPSGSASVPAKGATNPSASSETTADDPKPIFKGWDKPLAVLVLTGEQNGYLEPCGCSLTQSGGMSRRANLFAKIAERGWPVVGLDVGNLLKRSGRQDVIKFETILAALKDLSYQAAGVGPSELRLGPDYLLTQQVVDPEERAKSVGLTSANVTLFDSPDLGTPERIRVFNVGPVKVGVTAVLGKSLHEQVVPQGVSNNITLSDPAAAIEATLPLLKAESPDLLVLLSHGSTAEGEELAAKFPDFQVVLTAGGPEDPLPTPKKIGDTLVLQVGHKGKSAGVLGVFAKDAAVANGGGERLKFELIELDNKRFATTPKMDEHMRVYQERLKDESIATSAELETPHPRGGQFAGAQSCGECHTKAYAKWKESRHAHAFQILEVGRKGEEATWIPRIHDPECLACHVTGWNAQQVRRYTSGFVSQQATPHLVGQQCENCHGPGQQHNELEWQYKKDYDNVDKAAVVAARKQMHVDLDFASKHTCVQCHDYENSPKFKFAEYWEKVRHPWKD